MEEVRPNSLEVTAINPFGKIPVLQYGDLTLYESAAICRFIERQFEGPALSPQASTALAHMDQWISVVNCYLDPVIMRRCVVEYAFPSGKNGQINQAKIDAALPDVKRYLAIVGNALLASSFLAGKQPTIADYLLLPMLDYLAKVPPGEQLMSKAPAADQWLKRMRQRPACAKIIA